MAISHLRLRKGVDASFLTRVKRLPSYFGDREIPLFKKLGIVLGLFYVLSPIDLITDLLPVVGWLDDAGVLWLMYLFLMKELGRYTGRLHEGGELTRP